MSPSRAARPSSDRALDPASGQRTQADSPCAAPVTPASRTRAQRPRSPTAASTSSPCTCEAVSVLATERDACSLRGSQNGVAPGRTAPDPRDLRPPSLRSKRVFILGPSHHVYLDGCALSKCKQYETPLGNLPLDLDSASVPSLRGHLPSGVLTGSARSGAQRSPSSERRASSRRWTSRRTRTSTGACRARPPSAE